MSDRYARILWLVGGCLLAQALFFVYLPVLFNHVLSNTVNVGEGGDAYQLYYLSWSLLDNLRHGRSIFADYYSFAVPGETFINGEISLLYWLCAGFSLIFNPNFAYGLAFYYIPLHASLIFTYLLCERLSGRRWLALLCGLAVTFLPYRLERSLMVHQASCYQFFFPMLLYVLHRFYDKGNNKKSAYVLAQGLLLATTLLVTVGAELHIAYYAMLLGFSWLTFVFTFAPDGRPRLSLFKRYAGFLFGAALALFYAKWFASQVLSEGGKPTSLQPIDEVYHYSVYLREFFWSRSPYAFFPLLFRGWVWGLMIIGFLAYKRVLRRDRQALVFCAYYVLATCIFLILAAGTRAQNWTTTLYVLAFKYLPFFGSQRVPTKMLLLASATAAPMFAMTFTAVLDGLKTLQSRLRRSVLVPIFTVLIFGVFCGAAESKRQTP